MKKKTCLILLIAAVMMLSGCTLVVKDPEVDARRVIIDVNGETVDKRAFINIYNNALNEEYATQQMYQQFGMIQSINIDPDQVMQATMDGLVRRMVLLQKAKELKLDELTEEETAELAAATDASWQDSLDRIKRTDMADTELEGDELIAALEEKAVEHGITREVVEQSEREQMLLKKIRAAAEATGEKVWQLPLYEEYGEQLKSEAADYKNVGGRAENLVDLIILLVAVVAFAGLSAGVILAMNRQPKVRDPLASAKLPVGEQPLALTIVHTNDAWGYLFGCG